MLPHTYAINKHVLNIYIYIYTHSQKKKKKKIATCNEPKKL